MQRVLPIYRWGMIGPSRGGPVQVGPGYRFYRLVPPEVMIVSTGLVGLNDYTKQDVDRAIESYWECVDLLVKEKVDVIVFGGAPISAQLGRKRALELFDETRKRTGLPVSSTLESAIEAMNHLGVKKLWDYLCRYVYLPRLQDVNVLLEAIKDGVTHRDYFAYATRVGDDGRYQGLSLGDSVPTVYFDDASVLVKPEVAQQQRDADAQAAAQVARPETAYPPDETKKVSNGGAATPPAPATGPIARRFHGVVRLDETRIARDAGRIAEEIIQHLASQFGADVEITLEIHARLPGGTPDNVVRTVSENARTLKFESFGFEEE